MIYSASRRTDLPAFFPDYIVEKIGRSRKLEGVVYWTKDIRNFLCHPGLREAVLKYPSVIQYTVTGLAGTEWEPGVPGLREQLIDLRRLAEMLPVGAINWRFDPIIADTTLYARFAEVNALLMEAGVGHDSVTLSFPDLYMKVRIRLGKLGMSLPELDTPAKIEILKHLYQISKLRQNLCCEQELLDSGLEFIQQAHCVDAALFARLYNIKVDARADRGQRAECGCTRSTDIGSYELRCGHGCRYCYANPDI